MQVNSHVVDPSRRCIDLSDQRGGLTAAVLESLRAFLRFNDFYIRICVSDNLLGSEALAELCALVKRHPHLTSLEAQHCGLQDRDFSFYLGPALMSMPSLTFVDLSRNSGLTDASAETIARVLLETEVESVRLVGTSFSPAGGEVIAAAAANTTSLVNCELPFTVGNAVLAAVDVCTRRNRAHRERLNEATAQYTRLRVSRGRLPSLPVLKRMEAMTAHTFGDGGMTDKHAPLSAALPGVYNAVAASGGEALQPQQRQSSGTGGATDGDRQWRACIRKGRKQSFARADVAASMITASPALPSGVAAAATAVNVGRTSTQSSARTTRLSSPLTGTLATGAAAAAAPSSASSSSPSLPLSLTRRAKATPDSLDTVTMWDWVDPAMSTTLRCLFVLDHQAQVLEQQRAAATAPAVTADPFRRSKEIHRLHGRPTAREQSGGRRAAAPSLRFPAL